MVFDKIKKFVISPYTYVSILLLLPLFPYSFKFYKGFGLSDKQDVWGQFGDFYGGVLNPVFSFLTVLLLIITLRSQREEFQIIKLDSDQSKKDILKQNFEAIFFRYLKHIVDLINSFQEPDPKENSEGLQYIIEPGRTVLGKELKKAITDYQENREELTKHLIPIGILKIYSKSMKNILMYVFSSTYLNNTEKIFYFEIIKSQLVSREIFYLNNVLRILDSKLYEYLKGIGFFEDEFDFDGIYTQSENL